MILYSCFINADGSLTVKGHVCRDDGGYGSGGGCGVVAWTWYAVAAE